MGVRNGTSQRFSRTHSANFCSRAAVGHDAKRLEYVPWEAKSHGMKPILCKPPKHTAGQNNGKICLAWAYRL